MSVYRKTQARSNPFEAHRNSELLYRPKHTTRGVLERRENIKKKLSLPIEFSARTRQADIRQFILSIEQIIKVLYSYYRYKARAL